MIKKLLLIGILFLAMVSISKADFLGFDLPEGIIVDGGAYWNMANNKLLGGASLELLKFCNVARFKIGYTASEELQIPLLELAVNLNDLEKLGSDVSASLLDILDVQIGTWIGYNFADNVLPQDRLAYGVKAALIKIKF